MHIIMIYIVLPYRPNNMWITWFAMMILENLVSIPVLSQLKGKKLNLFKDQAGFDLQPTDKTASSPVLRYIISWRIDASRRQLQRKPTWSNFIQVLKEIDLSELAQQIEDFFIQTCPDSEPQQKKGIVLLYYCQE